MQRYRGQCHCGKVQVILHSAMTPVALGARSCGCTYCQMNAAAWTSDPTGTLEIFAEDKINRYRFGTKTADFLICPECGVVPAVVGEVDRQLLGVVNVNCLEARDEFLTVKQPADFDGELLEARLDRRAKLWTPTRIAGEVTHA